MKNKALAGEKFLPKHKNTSNKNQNTTQNTKIKEGRNYFFSKMKGNTENIMSALEKSSPEKVFRLNFLKTKYDFECGEFIFNLKGKNGQTVQIPLLYAASLHYKIDLNAFWEFLEMAVSSKETLFLDIIYGAHEFFVYFEPVKKLNAKFAILTPKNNSERILLTFEYSVVLDVLINKKEFISEFYSKITKIFKNYASIAYFEPPVSINFEYWKKDSEIIKKYLKIK